MKTIALITDFGLKDNFVGVMKGVIISMNFGVRIVDITHNVEIANVQEAAFLLLKSYCYFPHRTIFVAVVDPEVGSKRKAIGIETKHYFFIGPDNGVLSPAVRHDGIKRIVHLNNEKLFLWNRPSTFHGRDIFASCAGHLSKSKNINTLGSSLKTLQALDFPVPRLKKNVLEGQIIYIDRFGNLVTNITKKELDDFLSGKQLMAHIGDKKIRRIKKFYADNKDDNEAFFIEGGFSLLEVSLNKRSAQDYFKIKAKAKIAVERY